MRQADYRRIAQFLYEVGTMRKISRARRQTLLTDDMSDNIASHSYRVTMIGWQLAKLEAVDPYRVVMMCLLHDTSEARAGDQNWVHKKYVKVFDSEIINDQLGTLPHGDLKDFAYEYEARITKESIVAKDADYLDQILLLKEYVHQGNEEAKMWLLGEGGTRKKGVKHLDRLKTKSAKKIAEAILSETPSSWWKGAWTSDRR